MFAGLGSGLIVLGSHRTGTSGITGAIDAIGVQACRPEERIPASRWNERGFFESSRLSKFDEMLLGRLGGAWWAPPKPAPGWAETSEFEDLRTEAALLFAAAHPYRQWVWKDPRACVLMPFWDRVFGASMPRLIVLRDPLASAASLVARSHLSHDLALAIGERSLRSALRDSSGRPVLVTSYEDALADPTAWCSRVVAFLRQVGLTIAEPSAFDRAREFLDPALRHHHASTAASDATVPDGLRRLWEWAHSRRGQHAELSTAGLPDESPETDARISAAVSRPQPAGPQ